MERDDSIDAAPVAGTPVFDAILRPHRSLGPLGFVVLMSLVALVGCAIGVAFLLMGAWPVLGFCGLEIVLLYICFRLSYRSGRVVERVRLLEDALVVERFAADGQARRWTFQPYWLRVLIDDPPAHDSLLTLSSHGRSLVIGSFLTPAERLDFAQALRAALASQRAAPGA
jgi:uncharacterized membrane protein